MVASFRDVAKWFPLVVQYHGAAVFTGYLKAREVEVRERGYTILDDVADPLNQKFVEDVSLPSDELDSVP